MKLFGNTPKSGAAKPPLPPPEPQRPRPEAPVKQPEPKPRKQKQKRSGGKAALIAVIAVAAVLAAGCIAGVVAVDRVNTIFPNVTVDGLRIGGLSLSETAEKLAENGYGDLSGKTVTVDLPTDYTLTVSAEDVCTETPVSDIALMAWDACKGNGPFGNAVTYVRCALGGMALDSNRALTVDADAVRARVEAAADTVRKALLSSDLVVGEDSIRIAKGAGSVEIDTDALSDMIVDAFRQENYTNLTYEAVILPNTEMDMRELYDTVYTAPADAKYDKETDSILPETLGVSFDVTEAQRLWNAASYGDQVEIPLILTQPEVTEKTLKELLFRDCLSEKSTSLLGSGTNRVNNVRKAAASIDGVVLMPGDEFSYNEALGERTEANGYMLAGAYSGGQTVQEYGGGICQVSSTLYYCTLYANLKVTARTCHMFPVGYLPPGLDATVSWGGPEYKFVNDREYPVRIRASVDDDGREVTVELWGTDTDGSYVKVTADTWYMYDAKYTEVCTGYKAQTYRAVYDKDDNLISRKSEALSTYNYHPEDIEYPEETEEPENPEVTENPEPTEAPAPTENPEPTETPADTPVTELTPPPVVEEPVPTPPPAENPPQPADPNVIIPTDPGY